MPSSTSGGPPGQRPHRRIPALAVVLLLVLSAVAPFTAATAGAGTDDRAPAARSVGGVPHENATDGNLTLLVGPSASYDALDAFGDVATAHRADAIEREDEAISVGDTLIVAFTSERLGAEYADTTGPNASVRFFQALDGTDASLTITSPSGTECETLRVRLNESRHRVLANGTTGEFRLLLDTGALASTGGCSGELDIPGAYEVALERPTGDGDRRTTEIFYLDEPERDRDADPDAGVIYARRGAPAAVGDLHSAADIRRAARTGRLVRTGHVVHGEVAVLRVDSSRLTRAYANETGENATVRLLRAVNATGGRFRLDPRVASLERETETRDPPGVVLPGPGIRTVPDRANDTFYVVLDPDRVRVRTGDSETTLSNSTVDELRPTLVLGGPNRQPYEGRLRVIEPAGSFGIARNRSAETDRSLAVVGTDGRFVVRPGTNLAPGSSVTVAVHAENGTLAERTVELGDADQSPRREGAGVLTFDLGPQPAGRVLNVTLAHDGTELHRATALVGPRPVLRDATARVVRRGPEGPTVRFAVTARFPASGYVVVQNASGRYVGYPVPAGEPVRVQGTVTVPGGEEAPREVRFIAVYDDNRNGRFDGPRGDGHVDEPFAATDGEGGLLVRSVALSPPSPTPTITAPPPGTTIAVDEGPGLVSGGQSGFGVGAVLVALVAVVLLARRR